MQIRSVRALLWSLPLLLYGVLGPTAILSAQDADDDNEPTFLFGSGALTPPEGAPNQEANGSVHLLEKGERNALHIRVGHLEPGATYDVRATKGETSESIGSITTHDGTPPPPRCFKAKLTVPAPAPEPDPAAGNGGFHHGDRGESATAHGFALFNLNKEGTQLTYWIAVRGVGDIASATLSIGDAKIELEADGKGSIDVTAEQVAAIGEGKASVAVVGSGDAPITVSGVLEVCFAERREEVAARKAGRGTLRIDTGRGDKLPLAAETVEALVGVTFSVVDAAGATVLSGSVAELIEGGFHKPDDDGHHGGHQGADEPCEADLARPDPAPDADAAGEVEIEGEELEVEVWRLAKRATYDVVLIQPGEGGASATIGQLKTGLTGASNHEFVAVEGVALPFGKTKISELVGHGVEVKNADGVVVLKGAIPETACAAEKEDKDPAAGGGGSLEQFGADSFFQIDEIHDASFTRGDANDDGSVDLADAIYVLFYLFQGGSTPYCADASDTNDNGVVEISDPIGVLQYLFQNGAPIAAPYPLSGYDGTPDGLFCSPQSS